MSYLPGSVTTVPGNSIVGSKPGLPLSRVQDALAGATGIEGVRWLLGSRSVRKVIRVELGGLLSNPSQLGPCLLRRAKFKPGRKLSAYYDVGLVGDGQRPRSVALTWEPGAVGQQVSLTPKEAELEAQAIASGVAAPFARLAAGDPRPGLRILVAPLDAAFPQLVRVSTPGLVAELMARLGASPDDRRDEGRRTVEVTAVRYRPRQRHVLRYDWVDANGGVGGGDTLFAKLYNDGEDAPAFRVANGIADWVSSSTEASAIRPLAHIPEDGLVIYPKLNGVPLSNLPAARAAEPLAQAGAVLGALQRAPVDLFDDVRPHSFSGEARAVARASEHVVPLLPGTAAMIAAILERAGEVEGRLETEPSVLAHGDYKCDHIWVAQRNITLIDFNTCSLADPALDVGKFLADLHWWYSGPNQEGLRDAQRHFLAGYGAIPPSRMLRARLYEVLILTKITVRRVRLFDPQWAAKTDRLIRRAEGLLSDLESAVRAPSGLGSVKEGRP
jgi:hypothetical protein